MKTDSVGSDGLVPDSVVFVSCADSGELHVLHLSAATGQLRTEQVLPLGGQLMPMALSPDSKRLYVARRSDPLAVITLEVDGIAGRAKVLAEAPLPASMAHLSVDETGRWLLAASYGDDMVSVQAMDTDGAVRPETADTHTYATARHAHCVLTTPGNHFVLAVSLGGGQLHRYRLNASTGALVPTDPAVFVMPPGTGPRHLCFNTRGDRVYVLGELDAVVHVLSFDRDRGELSLLQSLPTMPSDFEGGAWGADLHLSPDGRWLYTSERNSHTLAGFAVDAYDGLLTPMGHWPTQQQPRGFSITDDGRYLVSAGQASHRVGVHAISPATGALTLVGECAVGQNPNWVTIVPLHQN